MCVNTCVGGNARAALIAMGIFYKYLFYEETWPKLLLNFRKRTLIYNHQFEFYMRFYHL